MQRRSAPNKPFPRLLGTRAGFALWQVGVALVLVALLLGVVFLRPRGEPKGKHDADSPKVAMFGSSPSPAPVSSRKARASWYDVPADSLAGRRAAPDEFTAAHDRLPLGTLVRVTNLKNGKTVLVRITDRGIHNRNVQLDLCKEAAGQLDMLRQGIARVRMDVLPETHIVAPPATETAAP